MAQKLQDLEAAFTERATRVAEQVAVALVGVEIRGNENARVVEIYIDRPEGIGIDQCTEFSKALDTELETLDEIGGRWRLEVSTPGIGRPMKFDWQIEREVGHKVKVVTTENESVIGTLQEFSGENVVLALDKKTSRTFPRTQVKEICSEVDFKR